jgi:uncharacterized protein (UPF0303 family)
MTAAPLSIANLEHEERDLVLQRFAHEEVWLLGSRLAERARREHLPVMIDIRRTTGVLFRAAMAGTTSDQDAWVDRKSATAFRFEASTLLVGLRMEADERDPFADGWLDPTRYTLAGGAVPIRVAGAGVVAVATVSGLSSQADHALVVDELRALNAGLR